MMERQQIKQIFGIVCVVEDLKEATENWRTMVEFDPGSVRTGKSAENVKHIYRGKEIMCRYKYMDFDMGGVRVRLKSRKINRAATLFRLHYQREARGSII